MSGLLLTCVAAFGSAALVVIAARRAWRAALAATAAVEARAAAPVPALWRLGGSWLASTGRIAQRLLPHGWQRRRAQHLGAAGLDGALTPGALVAGQLFAACLASAAVVLIGAIVAALASHGLVGAALPGTRHVAAAAVFGWWLVPLWLRDRVVERRRRIERQLPSLLDLLTIALEAGQSLSSALTLACDRLPPGPLQLELDRVLRDVRAGRPGGEALRSMAERLRLPGVSHLAAALVVGARQGVDLGPLLRAQAAQRRHERFVRAERLALQAPVKMLLPLATCVFPGTFAILFFPVAIRLLQQGLL